MDSKIGNKKEQVKKIITEVCDGMGFDGVPDHIIEIASTEIDSLYSDPPSPEMVFPEKPKIICLCGSTRFSEAFQKAQFDLTMDGVIVLTIGCNMKSDTELFKNYSEQELKDIKTRLDELHKRKIDLADEVLILNVGGYIGESTKGELEYARQHGKTIRFLEPKF
jgi:hypothetical protein